MTGHRVTPYRLWLILGGEGLRRCETLGALSASSHPVGHAGRVPLLLGGLLGFR
jgi:hypothetical protein